jgi:hypothetical protein
MTVSELGLSFSVKSGLWSQPISFDENDLEPWETAVRVPIFWNEFYSVVVRVDMLKCIIELCPLLMLCNFSDMPLVIAQDGFEEETEIGIACEEDEHNVQCLQWLAFRHDFDHGMNSNKESRFNIRGLDGEWSHPFNAFVAPKHECTLLLNGETGPHMIRVRSHRDGLVNHVYFFSDDMAKEVVIRNTTTRSLTIQSSSETPMFSTFVVSPHATAQFRRETPFHALSSQSSGIRNIERRSYDVPLKLSLGNRVLECGNEAWEFDVEIEEGVNVKAHGVRVVSSTFLIHVHDGGDVMDDGVDEATSHSADHHVTSEADDGSILLSPSSPSLRSSEHPLFVKAESDPFAWLRVVSLSIQSMSLSIFDSQDVEAFRGHLSDFIVSARRGLPADHYGVRPVDVAVELGTLSLRVCDTSTNFPVFLFVPSIDVSASIMPVPSSNSLAVRAVRFNIEDNVLFGLDDVVFGSLETLIKEWAPALHRKEIKSPGMGTAAHSLSKTLQERMLCEVHRPGVRYVTIDEMDIRPIHLVLSTRVHVPIYVSLEDAHVTCGRVHLERIVNAPVQELLDRLLEHYFTDVFLSLPSVVGSLETFGNPMKALRYMREGFQSIVTQSVSAWMEKDIIGLIGGIASETRQSTSRLTDWSLGAVEGVARSLAENFGSLPLGVGSIFRGTFGNLSTASHMIREKSGLRHRSALETMEDHDGEEDHDGDDDRDDGDDNRDDGGSPRHEMVIRRRRLHRHEFYSSASGEPKKTPLEDEKKEEEGRRRRESGPDRSDAATHTDRSAKEEDVDDIDDWGFLSD